MKTNKNYLHLLQDRTEDKVSRYLRENDLEDSPIARAIIQQIYDSTEEVNQETINIPGNQVPYQHINVGRVSRHIAQQIREVAEPYVGRPNDDFTYSSMVSAIEHSVQDTIDRGIIAWGSTLVSPDGRNVVVQYQPNMTANTIQVNVELNT